MTKHSLETKLYDGDLSLDELMKLREDMHKYDFSDYDYRYANELIADEIDDIEDVNELILLRNKYKLSGYDVELFDYAIDLKNVIHNKAIEDMDIDELTYVYENEDLELVDLIRLYTCMKRYNFSSDDIENIEFQIRNEINDIDDDTSSYEEYLDRLNKVSKECSKYDCDMYILEKEIYDTKEIIKAEDEKEPHIGLFGLGLAAFTGIASGFVESVNNYHPNNEDYLMDWERDLVNQGEYTEDQFEEEEMDEDDYYREDW